MPRYKLTIEYDGTGLSGWQRQEHLPTVQAYLETAITRFCGENVTLHAAGRTDAGVHAQAQVAHVDLAKEWEPHTVREALNFHRQSEQVSVTAVERVSEDFHARFSAQTRRYLYRILNRRAPLTLERHRAWHIKPELNAKTMHRAAQLLVGTHDFTSFRDTDCQSKSPVKTLDTLNVERQGDMVLIHAKSRSFLHHQVRIMVGSLSLIGTGKWTDTDIRKALAAQARAAAGPTAPSEGLYFMEVEYPPC